jgi:hypothetical protein
LKLPCAEKFEELQRPRQKSNRAWKLIFMRRD